MITFLAVPAQFTNPGLDLPRCRRRRSRPGVQCADSHRRVHWDNRGVQHSCKYSHHVSIVPLHVPSVDQGLTWVGRRFCSDVPVVFQRCSGYLVRGAAVTAPWRARISPTRSGQTAHRSRWGRSLLSNFSRTLSQACWRARRRRHTLIRRCSPVHSAVASRHGIRGPRPLVGTGVPW